MAVRSHGADARFLTVIEPYEQNSVIDHVEASDADHLTVWLSDGRRQDIQILHIDKDSVKIILTETKDNRVVYKEETD